MDINDIINRNKKELSDRDRNANKGTYRKLLVIGGSRGMAGAAYLCSLAAFRTGIGMVKVFGPECNRGILQTALPEAMYQSMESAARLKRGEPLEPGEYLCNGRRPRQEKNFLAQDIDVDALRMSILWADIVIIGPGLSVSAEARSLVQLIGSFGVAYLFKDKELFIIDADALNIISMFMDEDNERNDNAEAERKKPGSNNYGSRLFNICPNTVITPHVGEMSRLSGLSISYIKEHQAEAAQEFSRKYGVTVVLKDAVTAVITPKEDEALMIDAGCGAMAKAGSGDVLCGFIAGITAVLKGRVSDSVALAVYLHGRAGCIAAEEKGCHSILAEDMANCAGKAMQTAAISSQPPSLDISRHHI